MLSNFVSCPQLQRFAQGLAQRDCRRQRRTSPPSIGKLYWGPCSIVLVEAIAGYSPMTHYGDSYSGIWCGACSILVHGEAGQADAFVACCRNVPRAELRCSGCKSNEVYAGCRGCTLRDCAGARGVAHCSERVDFPCNEFAQWEKAVRLVPHIREVRSNLQVIHEAGVESWVSAQQSRWSCPDCGIRHAWYTRACRGCGRSLAGRTYTLNVARRTICSVLFPWLYKKAKLKHEQPSNGSA